MPRPADPDERRLADWVRYQRRVFDRLSEDQLRRLASIPGFSFDPRAEAFERRAAAYRAFVERRARPPRRHADEPVERALAVWAAEVREQYRGGRLPYSRLRAAADLGVIVR